MCAVAFCNEGKVVSPLKKKRKFENRKYINKNKGYT